MRHHPSLVSATSLPPRRQLKISYSKNIKLTPGRFGAAAFLASYGALRPMPLPILRDLIFQTGDFIGMNLSFLDDDKITTSNKDGCVQLDPKKLRENGIRITPDKITATRLAVLSLDTEQPEKVKAFITAYNSARHRMYTQQEKPYIGDFLVNTKERMSRVGKVIQFLDRLSVQPSEYPAYVYSVFQSKGWREAPNLYRFVGTVAADIWNNHRTDALSLLSDESFKVVEVSLSPWKDLDPMQEERKTSLIHQGHIENCLMRFSEFGGYHPKSEACHSCPQSANCRQMLLSSVRSFLRTPELIFHVREGGATMEQLAADARSTGHRFDPLRPPWQSPRQTTVPTTV